MTCTNTTQSNDKQFSCLLTNSVTQSSLFYDTPPTIHITTSVSECKLYYHLYWAAIKHWCFHDKIVLTCGQERQGVIFMVHFFLLVKCARELYTQTIVYYYIVLTSRQINGLKQLLGSEVCTLFSRTVAFVILFEVSAELNVRCLKIKKNV